MVLFLLISSGLPWLPYQFTEFHFRLDRFLIAIVAFNVKIKLFYILYTLPTSHLQQWLTESTIDTADY